LKPLPLDLVGDVHVLDAERAAVGLAELGEQIAAGAIGGAEKAAVAAMAVEVFQGEAEFGKFQERVGGAVVAERIEVGDEVAELAIGVDEIGAFDAEATRIFTGSGGLGGMESGG